MSDPQIEDLTCQLSAGRSEVGRLRAPFLEDFFSDSREPDAVLSSKFTRKRGLERRLREMRSASAGESPGGGQVLRRFRAPEPAASDGSTDIRDQIFDEITLLQREIDRYDPAAVAWSEARANRARQELPRLQARVDYEYERSGSFLGYVELYDPDACRQLAELEEGGLDAQEQLEWEALAAPFLPGYELVPHEYEAYLTYAREHTGAGAEVLSAEADIAGDLGAVIANLQQQIQELRERLASLPPIHEEVPPIPERIPIDGSGSILMGSDSPTLSVEEIQEQIEMLKREIAAITPEVLAMAEREREEGAREQAHVLARVEEEFETSRTLDGYIAQLAPRVAGAIAELEVSQPGSPALEALRKPFREGFGQQPQDLEGYVSFAKQAKVAVREALDRAEAMMAQRPEWVLVELEQRLEGAEEELELLEEEIAAAGGSRRFPVALPLLRPPTRDPGGSVLADLARVNAEIEALIPAEQLDEFIAAASPEAAARIAAAAVSNAGLEGALASRA